MAWNEVRRLILPTALTVTSISVLACSDGETSKNQPQVQCNTIDSGPCQKCVVDAGVSCAPSTQCFYDPSDDTCHSGIA
jgi:hypothetical protein